MSWHAFGSASDVGEVCAAIECGPATTANVAARITAVAVSCNRVISSMRLSEISCSAEVYSCVAVRGGATAGGTPPGQLAGRRRYQVLAPIGIFNPELAAR